MSLKFEMSLVGPLQFFLGLQVSQSKNGSFSRQSKYAKEIAKKFGLEKMQKKLELQWDLLQKYQMTRETK